MLLGTGLLTLCWLASEETEAQGDEADPVLTAKRQEIRFRQHHSTASFSSLELALGRVIPPFSAALFECAAEWKEHLFFVGKKFFPQRWFLILRTEVFISLVYLIQQGRFRTWTHNDRSHTAGYRKGCIHGSFMRGIILHKKWGRSLFICYFFFLN